MAGGANVGTLTERIARHYAAGCDLILVCSPEATAEVMQLAAGKRAKRSLLKTLRASRVARAKRMIGGQKFDDMQHRLTKLLEDV